MEEAAVGWKGQGYLCYCPSGRTSLETLLSSHGGWSPIGSQGREAQKCVTFYKCNHSPHSHSPHSPGKSGPSTQLLTIVFCELWNQPSCLKGLCRFSECTYNLHSFQPVWWWTVTRMDKTSLQYHCKEELLDFINVSPKNSREIAAAASQPFLCYQAGYNPNNSSALQGCFSPSTFWSRDYTKVKEKPYFSPYENSSLLRFYRVCALFKCASHKSIFESNNVFFKCSASMGQLPVPERAKQYWGRWAPPSSMTPGMENPFLHVQLLLQPPDATAASEWEPGFAAPHSPLLRNGQHTAFNYMITHYLVPQAAVLLKRIMNKAQLSVEPFLICWESWQVCSEQKETQGKRRV